MQKYFKINLKLSMCLLKLKSYYFQKLLEFSLVNYIPINA